MRHILAIITCLFLASVQAQDYPARPIRLIVPIGRGLSIAPADRAGFLQEEVQRWGSLVTRYGVKVD